MCQQDTDPYVEIYRVPTPPPSLPPSGKKTTMQAD